MNNIWFAMIGLGILTFLTRYSFIVLFHRMDTPALVKRGLRFVPVAVLTAIFVPELVMPDGALALAPSNLRLLAGLVAILVAWRTKNVLWTIVIGMAVFWGLKAIGGT